MIYFGIMIIIWYLHWLEWKREINHFIRRSQWRMRGEWRMFHFLLMQFMVGHPSASRNVVTPMGDDSIWFALHSAARSNTAPNPCRLDLNGLLVLNNCIGCRQFSGIMWWNIEMHTRCGDEGIPTNSISRDQMETNSMLAHCAKWRQQQCDSN